MGMSLMPLIWIIIAVILTLVEVLTLWIWSICIAAGALLAAVAALLGCSLAVQLIIIAIGAVAFFVCFGKMLQRMHERRHSRHGDLFNSNMDALKGRRALVTESTTDHQHARVRIDGDNWQVMLQNHRKLHRNDEIEIVDHDSIVLIANLISSANPSASPLDPER